MRHAGLLTLVSLVLAAAPAAGEGVAEPVELVQPAEGARLLAGGTAEVEWRAGSALLEGPAIVEWEAFLSLDGGRSYPFRITPHLDRRLRRFTWQVPAVPSEEARILLRVGDEHSERAFEADLRFSILPAPFVPSPPVFPALGRGEAARARDAGVVAWVEGSRQGRDLRLVQATPDSLQPGLPGLAAGLVLEVEAEEGSEVRPGPPGLVASGDPAPSVECPGRFRSSLPPAPPAISILLQTQRLNE